MRFHDVKRHLKPYKIFQQRRTTINHAIASAIAPSDEYDPEAVAEAMRHLGQNPEEPLNCVYCGNPAETWDHVVATVKKSQFSGAGHRLGNLLPCCKPCNSKKGNKDWKNYILQLNLTDTVRNERMDKIERHLARYFVRDEIPETIAEYSELISLQSQILALLQKADEVADSLRRKLKQMD